MADVLTPNVGRCIFSFVEMYKKLRFNMPELMPLSVEDMGALARVLEDIAAEHGLWLQTCGTSGDFSRYGIHPSGCLTLDILGRANGVEFRRLKHRGMRAGCHCFEARDIGAYDTAPTVAGTAMPTRITSGRPRTTACMTRRARSS